MVSISPNGLTADLMMAQARTNGNGHQPGTARVIREAPPPNANVDPAFRIPGMPPNFGEYAIPHVMTMQGLLTTISKTYRASDEALQHSWDNARFMRTDCGIMECLEARQRSVALLDWHLEPEDSKSEDQRALCTELTKIIERIPNFTKYRSCLQNAVWFGRYGIQHRYQWQEIGGKMRVLPTAWKPIHGDKFVFRYDDWSGEFPPDQVGIRASLANLQNSQSSVRFGDIHERVEPTERGMAYFLNEWERKLITLHKHQIEDGAYENPVEAGNIHGVGIRSRIYWDWFQRQEALGWLMEYMERSAFGVELWYYPMGNPNAREATLTAAKERIGQGRNIVLVPRPVGEDAMSFGVEHIQTDMSGAEVLMRIITDYFGRRMKRYILGQTLTSESDATGLGSELAQVHLGTYMDVIAADARDCEESITTDLLRQIQLWNFPQSKSIHLRFCIETESPDSEEKLKAITSAWNLGARISEKNVLDAAGVGLPSEDDKILVNPNLGQNGPQGGDDLEHLKGHLHTAFGVKNPVVGGGSPAAERPGQQDEGDNAAWTDGRTQSA